MDAPRPKISAFVISFNRAELIGTCLRALRFADELIVVDKSSTDETALVAARYADRVITVPWSPTVEDTRTFASSQCLHDWIIFADDDEIFSPDTAAFIAAELPKPQADIYEFPRRDYILGVHDELAYYWPEHHVRCFRRGAVAFGTTVHAAIVPRSNRLLRIPADSGPCIHHLSHQDVAQWIEKANRYTSCADRAQVAHAGADLAGFAHARIDHWLACTRGPVAGEYPQAVALLRAIYDLIDRLKTWEEERGLDGAAAFRRVCAEIDRALGPSAPERPAVCATAAPTVRPGASIEAILRASLHVARAEHDAAVQAAADHAAALSAELAELRAVLDVALVRAAAAETAACASNDRAEAAARRAAEAAQQAAAAAEALRAIETSTCWRATAWPRRVAGRLRARG